MSAFQNEVQHCFPYLFNKWGFKFLRSDNDCEDFVAIAESDTLKIRFIRDRTDFFLDVTRINELNKWQGFYKILDSLNATQKTHIKYKYSNKMKTVSSLLEEQFPKIQDFFANRSN